MRPVWHAAVAIGCGIVVYQITKNYNLALACASAEVSLDVDHLLEHFIWSEKPFSIQAFLSKHNTYNWSRIIFFLHSYEFILLLGIFSWCCSAAFWYYVFLGAIVHIVLDEIGNRSHAFPRSINWAFYFFSYRCIKGFRTEALMLPREEYLTNGGSKSFFYTVNKRG